MRAAWQLEEPLPPQLWVSSHAQRAPSPEGFQPVKNRWAPTISKPESGGLWTASWREGGSSWTEWMSRQGWDWEETGSLWLLEVSPRARVLHLSGSTRLQELIQAYTYLPEDPLLQQLGELLGGGALDFQALQADGWDALHLSQQGLRETGRLSQDPPNLGGWDCESTLWLNWTFTQVSPLTRGRASAGE